MFIFFTTCPGICPKLTSNMFKLQDTFINDEEVLLLSHSVMPSVDNEHVLNEYGKLNSIDSKKWNLVTGDKDLLVLENKVETTIITPAKFNKLL